jgi:hypothetical protein
MPNTALAYDCTPRSDAQTYEKPKRTIKERQNYGMWQYPPIALRAR